MEKELRSYTGVLLRADLTYFWTFAQCDSNDIDSKEIRETIA